MKESRHLISAATSLSSLAILSAALIGGTAEAAPGDPLGPPIPLLGSLYGNYSIFIAPSIMRDSAGNTTVFWIDPNSPPAPTLIMGQRFASDGTPLGGNFRLAPPNSKSLTPVIAMNGSGQLVAAWPQNGSVGAVFSFDVQTYQTDGTPSGASIPLKGLNPALSVADDGHFVVAWETFLPIGIKQCMYPALGSVLAITSIKAQQFNASGSTLDGTATVDSVITPACTMDNIFPGVFTPAVTLDPQGNFVVAYNRLPFDSGTYEIDARRYSPSSTAQGSRFKVLDGNIQPLIGGDAAGNFVIGSEIQLQRYSPSGIAQGNVIQLPSGYATTSLAVNGAGDFVVGESGSDADSYSGSGVFVQRFAPDGSSRGAPELVAAATASSSSGDYESLSGPNVAIDANGNFALTWTDTATNYTNEANAQFQYYLSLFSGP